MNTLNEYQIKFCEDNIELTKKIAGSFISKYSFSDRDDIFSEAYYTLINCVVKWNSKLGEFSPYLSKSIYSNCWRMIHKNKSSKKLKNSDLHFSAIEDVWNEDARDRYKTKNYLHFSEAPDIKFDIIEYINQLSSILSARERASIKYFFIDELSQKDIAKVMGISSSAISCYINRAINKLKKRQKVLKVSKEILLSSF